MSIKIILDAEAVERLLETNKEAMMEIKDSAIATACKRLIGTITPEEIKNTLLTDPKEIFYGRRFSKYKSLQEWIKPIIEEVLEQEKNSFKEFIRTQFHEVVKEEIIDLIKSKKFLESLDNNL